MNQEWQPPENSSGQDTLPLAKVSADAPDELSTDQFETAKLVATPSQDDATQPTLFDRIPWSARRQRRGNQDSAGVVKRRWWRYALLALLMAVIISGSYAGGVAFQEFMQVRQAMAQARQGVQRLKAGKADLEALMKNPLDSTASTHLGIDSEAAYQDFSQVQHTLATTPGYVTLSPTFRDELAGAKFLTQAAIDISKSGIIASQAFAIIIARLHSPLGTKQQGITLSDLTKVRADAAAIVTQINDAINQLSLIQPAQLAALQQQIPSLVEQLAAIRQQFPALRANLDTAQRLLAIAPQLLGIGTPTNYLIEILDSTELRPGGGFIGNYGVATVSGGRLTDTTVTDTYLLDHAFESRGGFIAFPSQFNWFPLAQSWSLRDSNLDADFPTSARFAEANYHTEGGTKTVQGVFAITPAFVQRILRITGPVRVPEYGETITDKNLIARIHYYQLGPGHGSDSVVPPGGTSSARKRFTELLGKDLLAKIRALPKSALSSVVHAVVISVQRKDIQIYLNNSSAEQFLSQNNLASTVLAPKGDSLFIVDANITATKANSLVTNTLHDQVTIDSQGRAIHHTVMTVVWNKSGNPYGNSIYGDYISAYAPPGSTLSSQSGWSPRGTRTAHGRLVWAGYIQLSYGQSRTITLNWINPHAAIHSSAGWSYRYEIQRQAGQTRIVSLQVTLPACAGSTIKWDGLRASKGTTATYKDTPTADIIIGADYTCTP